jgi:hypothetical protein
MPRWCSFGPPGVSKTHLAVAIGRQAILVGYTVLFVPALTLVAQLAKAHTIAVRPSTTIPTARGASVFLCVPSKITEVCL